MGDQGFGWLSLAPPVVAILLAIVTRRVITSLLCGVVIGGLLLEQNPWRLIVLVTESLLWPNLIEESHLRVFCFTLLMGAMVGIIHQAGGMQSVVSSLAPLARSRRGGQFMTWLLGLIVFIDDYANCLLLGHTMRPLADRLRISREKLAYLVDSTAAPVSGLALISTWIAGEIGAIEDGFRRLGGELASVDGMEIFIRTIPYRFYVWGSLLFVVYIALSGRDFGPMYRAERRRLREDVDESSENASDSPDGETPHGPYHWLIAVVPILVTLGMTLLLLALTGASESDVSLQSATNWMDWVRIIGNGDSYVALVYGSLSGLFAAITCTFCLRAIPYHRVADAAFTGARHVMPALAILWMAWTISQLTDDEHLGTAQFMAGLLETTISPSLLPTIVFLLASVVAFSTGTSWGTMSLLMPLVVQTAYHLLSQSGAPFTPHDPLLLGSVGGVLAGAIFGDHCSPISDTTVLSSQASGCHHIAHVRTQIPYALLVATCAVLFGTLPVGWGIPVSWLIVPVALTMWIGLRVLGRVPTAEVEEEAPAR